MSRAALEIPDIVRRKALAEGPVGQAWIDGLPDVLADLSRQWGVSLGRTLAGGTEALVVEAELADGRQAVLKLGFPGPDPALSELNTLLAAQGRGYARLHAHDAGRNALLLERLGPQLAQLGLPTESQIEVICATLSQAWRTVADPMGFMTGADKAKSLADFIETTWVELDRPCTDQVVERALLCAEMRGRAFDADQAVLAHGDAHAWNTLQVPGDPSRFKFVDPDGLFVEKAYDLAIPMREWSPSLLAGDPLVLGRRRCQRLADLTGVDPEPIWQWGLIERVSTGLLCLKVDLDGAQDMLAVAEAWAAG